MRKIFTLILVVVFALASFAQERPTGVIKKANVAPVIDGEIDTVWNGAIVYNIDKPYGAETPTLGEVGETTWRALWDSAGIYILVVVNDDDFYPHYLAGSDHWMADKVEVYFDVNYNLEDNLGPSQSETGHYQVAPAFGADILDGQPTTDDAGFTYAFKVADPTYVAEYFVPFSMLTPKEGSFDKSEKFGFDVTIVDKDESTQSRDRMVWANVGLKNESWSNMDDCGWVTMEGGVSSILIDEIELTGGGDITEDNQTVQITKILTPENVTSDAVIWKIMRKDGSPCRATISSDGIVTPVVDEDITIQAFSPDYFAESNVIEISITGQEATLFELSYIKNGDFSEVDTLGVPDSWEGFQTGTATVVDGVLEFGPTEVLANQWDYKLLQITSIPFVNKDLSYIVSFKAWADAPRTLPLIFEDSAGDWASYASSSEEGFSDKTWLVNLTTEPTVYTLKLTFDKMKESTVQNFNFQVGLDNTKIYMDSLYLIVDETPQVAVEDIILTGGSISADNDTLRIGAEVLPANATNKSLLWSVATAEGSTGRARIDNSGLLTALLDGTVTVTAKSFDGQVEKSIDVEISGQEVTVSDVNIIKNGDMSLVDGTSATFWGGWTDASPAHTVAEGVSVHTPVGSADVWRYQFTQNNLTALPNIPYVFKFKAWADEARSFNVDFEDTEANGYNRYGVSSDPRANVAGVEGRSEWRIDVTTEPAVFTFDVIFDQIIETTDQKLLFALGESNIPVYIDDVSLISEADMDLFTGVTQDRIESFKIYPNPATSKLHINLPEENLRVEIYSIVGVKMEETIAYGRHHVVDVSNYQPGLYFVKVDDVVMKFIR